MVLNSKARRARVGHSIVLNPRKQKFREQAQLYSGELITVKQKPEATIRWKEKSETNLEPIMEESQSEDAGERESSLLTSRSMRTRRPRLRQKKG